jgi:hypothetical protein
MGARRLRNLIHHAASAHLCLVPLSREGFYAVVDKIDAPYVAQYRWAVKQDHKALYAKTVIDGHHVLLHRFIWALHARPEARLIDHKDGDGLNNQLSNLRAASTFQNTANRGDSALSSSGIRGVALRKGLWRVRLKQNGKEVHVGYFRRKRDAVRAQPSSTRSARRVRKNTFAMGPTCRTNSSWSPTSTAWSTTSRSPSTPTALLSSSSASTSTKHASCSARTR